MDLLGQRGHYALNGRREESLFDESHDDYQGRAEPSHMAQCRRGRIPEDRRWHQPPQPAQHHHQHTTQHPRESGFQLPGLPQVLPELSDSNNNTRWPDLQHRNPAGPLQLPSLQPWSNRAREPNEWHLDGDGWHAAGNGDIEMPSSQNYVPYILQAQWSDSQPIQGHAYRSNAGSGGLNGEPQRFSNVSSGRTMEPRATPESIHNGGVNAHSNSARQITGNTIFSSSPTETEPSNLPFGFQIRRRSRTDLNDNAPSPSHRAGNRLNLARLRNRHVHAHSLYHQTGNPRSGSPPNAHAAHPSQAAPRSPGVRRRINSNSRSYRNMASLRVDRASETRAVPPPRTPEQRLLQLAPQLEEYLERHTHFHNRSDKKKVASRKMLKTLIEIDIQDLDEGDRSCSICYQDFGETSPEGITEKPVRFPKCRHVFGDECLKKWLLESYQCPYCRAKMDGQPQGLEQRDMEAMLASMLNSGLVPPHGRMPAEIADGFPRLHDFLLDILELDHEPGLDEGWGSDGGGGGGGGEEEEEEEEEDDDDEEEEEEEEEEEDEGQEDDDVDEDQEDADGDARMTPAVPAPRRTPQTPQAPQDHQQRQHHRERSPRPAPRTPTPPTSQRPVRPPLLPPIIPPIESIGALVMPMPGEPPAIMNGQTMEANSMPRNPATQFQDLVQAASAQNMWVRDMQQLGPSGLRATYHYREPYAEYLGQLGPTGNF